MGFLSIFKVMCILLPLPSLGRSCLLMVLLSLLLALCLPVSSHFFEHGITIVSTYVATYLLAFNEWNCLEQIF